MKLRWMLVSKQKGSIEVKMREFESVSLNNESDLCYHWYKTSVKYSLYLLYRLSHQNV